jgi:hypothetical protein
MSTPETSGTPAFATTPAAPAAPAPPKEKKAPDEVTVISHSMLLYWWPVWLCGFIMAGITWYDGWLLANVPPGTLPTTKQEVRLPDGDKGEREILIAPKDTQLERAKPDDAEPDLPHVRISRSHALGVIFFTVLLVVIFITNVPLRGMWSVFVIILAALVSLILHLAGVWNEIIERVSLFDVRVNLGGYMFFSIGLFILWFAVVVFFDRRIYIVFSPRSFRVCTEIGQGEKVFDTVGMKLERRQADLFRHYVLGLGAGDLVVKTFGAAHEQFDLDNVLWISSKIHKIEEMLREKGGLDGK